MLARWLTSLLRPLPPRRQRAAPPRALECLEHRRLLAVTSIRAWDDVAPVVGAMQAGGITNDRQPSIAILTPHPSALVDVTVYSNGGAGPAVQQVENLPTNSAGTAWFSTPKLADGDYLIRARAGVYAKYFFICDPGLAEHEAEGTLAFHVDSTRPGATLSAGVRGPTNVSPIPFVLTFTEPVSGFAAADAIVTNGAVERMTASGPRSFTLFVQPTAAGVVSVRIPSGVGTDAASNPNTASNSVNVTFDPIAPSLLSVVRQPVSDGITNADTLVFRTNFSEPVLNVDASDFRPLGTTAGITRAVQIGPRTFDLTVSGGNLAGLNGPVGIEPAPGNDIRDAAGNTFDGQTPRVNQRYFLDNLRPTVRLSTSAISPTSADFIPVVARFSESVSGFSASDVSVTNGAVVDFSGTGTLYRFNIVPAADGRVTIAVPPSVATDAAGNANFASNGLALLIDRTAPTVQVTTSLTSPTNWSAIPFRVLFSENVTGLAAGDLVVTNGAISGFTGSGNAYRFQVIPIADGEVNVRVPAGVAKDRTGNGNLGSATASIISDRTPPTPTLSTSVVSPTNDALIPVRLHFSEAISGLTLADLTVINGAASNLTGSGANYQFFVTPLADGTITVRLPTATVIDAAGNGNLAAAPLFVVSDRTRPVATVSSPVAGPTNANLIPFRVAFDEPVIGFAAADVTLANGTIMSFAANADGSYTITVAPNGDGPVQVTVPADSARDAADNANFAGSFSVVSDRTPPLVTLTYNPPPAGALNLGTVTISFTEPVTGLDITDLSIRFPEVQFPLNSAMLTGSGKTYTLDLSSLPIQPGGYSLRLTAAGSDISDLAGNALLVDGDTIWQHTFGNP